MRKREARARHKRENEDNEGITWMRMDIFHRHEHNEVWSQEICVIVLSRNLRDSGTEVFMDILKCGYILEVELQ